MLAVAFLVSSMLLEPHDHFYFVPSVVDAITTVSCGASILQRMTMEIQPIAVAD